MCEPARNVFPIGGPTQLPVSPPTLCQQSHLWDLQPQLKQNLRMKQRRRSDGVSARDREKKEERERERERGT